MQDYIISSICSVGFMGVFKFHGVAYIVRYASIYLSTYLSIYLSIYPSVHLYVCIHVYALSFSGRACGVGRVSVQGVMIMSFGLVSSMHPFTGY